MDIAATVNPQCTEGVMDLFLRRMESQVNEFMEQYSGVMRAPGSFTRERDIARARRINNKLARLLSQPLAPRNSLKPVSRVRPTVREPAATPEQGVLTSLQLQSLEEWRDMVAEQHGVQMPSLDTMVTLCRRDGRVSVRIGRRLRETFRVPVDSQNSDSIILD
jgi:hypothetical protein